jgi:hypothetical protein
MNSKSTVIQRVLFAAVGLVAVIGIASVAYGAANKSPATIAEQAATAAVAGPTNGAVAFAASATPLSSSEVDGIVFMVEEEKLARDVYLTLGDLWDLPIFSNIASAEQTHMDAVLGLVDTYGLVDPVGENAVGVFVDRDLQALYDELIATGSESREAALEVGAVIEEVDIEDLENYLDETTAPDVSMVFERLLSGSKNHLRAFVSQLEASGTDRDPVVLDADAYESILASSASGGHGGQGQGRGHGGGQGGGGRGQNA